MPRVVDSTDTFRSQLGIFVWFTREELRADSETLKALVEQANQEMVARLFAAREAFLDSPEYEAIVVNASHTHYQRKTES